MNEKTYRNEAIDIQLAEHVRGCKSCSVHAAAGQIISRAFKIERVKSAESETPLAFLKTRIETLASQSIIKEHNVMSSFKERIMNHPMMSFSFAGAFVLLLLAATIPVSCSRTVGYSVGVDGSDSPIAEAITSDADGTASITFQRDSEGHIAQFDSRKIVEALHALGISDAKLELSASELGQTITISGLASREQARDALLAIVEVAGAGDKAHLSSRQASVSGTLLEHALSSLNEIFIDSRGLSDQELHDRIVAKLAESGVLDAEVNVMTGDAGEKMMFIGYGNENDSMSMEQVIEWKADGGDAGFNFKGSDSSVVIDIKTDGDQQTITVDKEITVGSPK